MEHLLTLLVTNSPIVGGIVLIAYMFRKDLKDLVIAISKPTTIHIEQEQLDIIKDAMKEAIQEGIEEAMTYYRIPRNGTNSEFISPLEGKENA